MEGASDNYFLGTSGLLLPVPNKLFYPEAFKEKSRLCYYGSLTNSLEINSSFYKVPQASTMRRWADDVPDNFLFTFKLFKELTHRQDLAFDPQLVADFMKVISEIGEKKGCLLIQFPPSVRFSHLRQLHYLMTVLKENDPDRQWKMAFEFRHDSLYTEEIFDLLDNYGFTMVIHDKVPVASPIRDFDANFVYLRFHGPKGDYRGSYSNDTLFDYAMYITDWLSQGKQVFIYFNNTMGDAFANLRTLKSIVQENFGH